MVYRPHIGVGEVFTVALVAIAHFRSHERCQV